MKNKIKKLRIQHGLTQRELFEKTGVKILTISNYERQLNTIPPNMAVKLAKAFNLNWWELYEEE